MKTKLPKIRPYSKRWEELANQQARPAEMKQKEKIEVGHECHGCYGTGRIVSCLINVPCNYCNGTGRDSTKGAC